MPRLKKTGLDQHLQLEEEEMFGFTKSDVKLNTIILVFMAVREYVLEKWLHKTLVMTGGASSYVPGFWGLQAGPVFLPRGPWISAGPPPVWVCVLPFPASPEPDLSTGRPGDLQDKNHHTQVIIFLSTPGEDVQVSQETRHFAHTSAELHVITVNKINTPVWYKTRAVQNFLTQFPFYKSIIYRLNWEGE